MTYKQISPNERDDYLLIINTHRTHQRQHANNTVFSDTPYQPQKYYSRLRRFGSKKSWLGLSKKKNPEIAPLRVAMRGGDVAAAEAGSPRSPDLYDLSDDSDYAAAAAASDHTVLPPPVINSMLPQFI